MERQFEQQFKDIENKAPKDLVKEYRKYIDERLPEEYEKCLVRLTAILREA
jgi:hypothetical protein